MGLEDAFHHPRIDVSGGDTVIADDSLPEATLAAVRAQHAVVTTRRAPYPYAFACPAGVLHEEGRGYWGAPEPFPPWRAAVAADRTSVVPGKRVSVRDDLGGRRISKNTTTKTD